MGSQATITFGVKAYVEPYTDRNRDYAFIGISNVAFFATLIISEIVYRARNKSEVKLGGDPELESISKAEFAEMVNQ